jgi:hypothetical protein
MAFGDYAESSSSSESDGAYDEDKKKTQQSQVTHALVQDEQGIGKAAN